MNAIQRHNELSEIIRKATLDLKELSSELLLEINQSDNPLQLLNLLETSGVKYSIASEININN